MSEKITQYDPAAPSTSEMWKMLNNFVSQMQKKGIKNPSARITLDANTDRVALFLHGKGIDPGSDYPDVLVRYGSFNYGEKSIWTIGNEYLEKLENEEIRGKKHFLKLLSDAKAYAETSGIDLDTYVSDINNTVTKLSTNILTYDPSSKQEPKISWFEPDLEEIEDKDVRF